MAPTKRVILQIDPEKCQGHGRCKALAPKLFRLDEFGNSHVVGDGVVPEDDVEKAYLAKSNCPEFAVEIVED